MSKAEFRVSQISMATNIFRNKPKDYLKPRNTSVYWLTQSHRPTVALSGRLSPSCGDILSMGTEVYIEGDFPRLGLSIGKKELRKRPNMLISSTQFIWFLMLNS